MKGRQIYSLGLALLLFSIATPAIVIFARTTTQYQLYRLSDDPLNDRRPKLAINDQG